jgi:hypothetical protein
MNDARNFFESLINGIPFPQDLTRGRKKKGRVFYPLSSPFPPQFLRKEPRSEKNPEERGASAWGSGWRNSDHHPKAVILSLGRACPGEIRKGRWFGSVLPLELFPRRPLIAEDRRKGG